MTTAITQCSSSMDCITVETRRAASAFIQMHSVGFGIAYSVVKGNAKASIRGISKVADSRASFYVFA